MTLLVSVSPLFFWPSTWCTKCKVKQTCAHSKSMFHKPAPCGAITILARLHKSNVSSKFQSWETKVTITSSERIQLFANRTWKPLFQTLNHRAMILNLSWRCICSVQHQNNVTISTHWKVLYIVSQWNVAVVFSPGGLPKNDCLISYMVQDLQYLSKATDCTEGMWFASEGQPGENPARLDSYVSMYTCYV